jgi:hypothetical protein
MWSTPGVEPNICHGVSGGGALAGSSNSASAKVVVALGAAPVEAHPVVRELFLLQFGALLEAEDARVEVVRLVEVAHPQHQVLHIGPARRTDGGVDVVSHAGNPTSDLRPIVDRRSA